MSVLDIISLITSIIALAVVIVMGFKTNQLIKKYSNNTNKKICSLSCELKIIPKITKD
jgi:hypothetical protein